MRVAIVTNEYPPYIFGGIGTFCQNLAEALAEKGTDVLVIAGSPEKAPTRTRTRGPHPVEVLSLPRGSIPPNQFWFQLKNMNRIRRELESCDLVHGQDSSAFPMLQFCKRFGPKVPWVVTFHTNPQAELHLTIGSFLRGGSLTDFVTYAIGFPSWDTAVREHARCADRLVTVSGSLRDELCRGYGLSKEALTVIPTCIHTSQLQSMFRSRRKHRAEASASLLYAGRLYYRKGVLNLLNIARCLVHQIGVANFKLQIFGSGPLGGVCRSYVSKHQLGDYVKIRGFVSRWALLTELANSDIVCVPSYYEACPVVIIEAMAGGKPVVAFDLPYAREMLTEESRMLLASNELDYAMKLASLINSEEDRARIGRVMKSRAARFDAQSVAASYQTLYSNLMGS
jgi:glycosyltransferase involved in cell wall biosynthesis